MKKMFSAVAVLCAVALVSCGKKDAAKAELENTQDQAEEVVNAPVVEGVEVQGEVLEVVENANDSAQSMVDQAKQAAKDATNQAIEGAKDAANKAIEEAKGAAKSAAQDAANEALENAKQAASDALNNLKK